MSAGKPYSILKLNDWSDRSWAVVDAKGAVFDLDGLSLKLTKQEAQAIADKKNAEGQEGQTALAARDGGG